MLKSIIFLLTFSILASPAYFKFLHSVLGGWAASSDGLARPAGLLFAGVVFMFVTSLERSVSGYGFSNINAALRSKDPCVRAKYLQTALNNANRKCKK